MVKERITFVEMKNCVDMAVDLCFEEGVYQPYIKDFAVWTSLMTFFTDEIKKEMSLEEQYAVTCNTNLREAIMNNCQASYIYDAILESIDIKVKKEIRKTRLDKIIDTVISVVNTPEMLEKLNGLMDMANEWLDEIETVEKNGEKVKN